MPTDVILDLMSYFNFLITSFYNFMVNLLTSTVGEVLEETLDLGGVGLPDWGFLDTPIFELILGASMFIIAVSLIKWLKELLPFG